MEAEQHAAKLPTGYWRNQKGNQKISRNMTMKIWQLKTWNEAKAVLREKFIAIQSYLKKQEKHWLDNLTLNLKQLEKEEEEEEEEEKQQQQQKTKWAEGDYRGWEGWKASPTQWTWVWASSRRWWRIGKIHLLQSMGSQRGRHDWATEQQP